MSQNGASSPLRAETTRRQSIMARNTFQSFARNCSRLNKSVMSFNDDDKDKNAVSSLTIYAREKRFEEAKHKKITKQFILNLLIAHAFLDHIKVP